MSKPRVGAIIPVKTFSRAKTRLNLSAEKTEKICEIMLNSVLHSVSSSDIVEKTVLISKDERALSIGKKFGVLGMFDELEQGVNHAVRIADDYFSKEGFEATMVFPQDIPLVSSEDISTLFQMRMQGHCVVVVPSRKFDGTNGLFRTPVDVMETHYDEDSYKIHISTAEQRNAKPVLALIHRMMLDIDDMNDLNLILNNFDNNVTQSIKKAIQ